MKKVVSLLVASTLVFSLLTACGKKTETPADPGTTEEGTGTEEPATTEPEAEKEAVPVTLRTVSMHGGTDPKAAIYEEIITNFQAENPHVTIEDESQSSDEEWKTRIAADFAIGNEPDVIQFFTDANAVDVLATNKFVTIEEIKAVYPDYAKDILPDALQGAANSDGVQRAVPTTGFWEGLFCNKDLFDQYSLELPTDWDKFTKAVETFKANGITPVAVSLNEVPHYWVEFLLLSAAGPEGYTQVPTEAPAEWVAGLEMFKTLRDMGAFPIDTDTINNEFAGELFKTKKAAMQLDGNWFLGGVTDTENTVVCEFPVIPGGKAQPGAMVAGISSGFYITRKAWDDVDKRDAAVKFVMANTNQATVEKYWGGNGQSAVAAEAPADMTPLAKSGAEYSVAASSFSAPTDSRMGGEPYVYLIGSIVDISTGAKSAEDVVNEMIALYNK